MHSFSSSRFLVREISQRHGFAARLGEYRLQQQWGEIAGTFVASHTWPTRIRFHTLYVAVENSVWLHQLTYLKATLLEKIQSEMKEITLQDIIFRIGDIPKSPEHNAAAEEEADALQTSPDARKTAANYTQVVRDKALRDSLTRVIATALSSAPVSGTEEVKQAGKFQNPRNIP